MDWIWELDDQILNLLLNLLSGLILVLIGGIVAAWANARLHGQIQRQEKRRKAITGFMSQWFEINKTTEFKTLLEERTILLWITYLNFTDIRPLFEKVSLNSNAENFNELVREMCRISNIEYATFLHIRDAPDR